MVESNSRMDINQQKSKETPPPKKTEVKIPLWLN